MAIHCLKPNDIGTDAENMYNITNTTGRNLITSFASTIESLKKNWVGTDAVANLNDLAKAYTVVTDFVKVLQQLIVAVNNDEILPLQRHINSSGGSCTVGKDLAFRLGDLSSSIQTPQSAVETRTEPGIITDAETFNTFPDQLDKFVTSLNDAKDVFLANWLDGSQRAAVVAKFNEFQGNYDTLFPKVKKVRDNLNVVAENKKQLM